MLALFEHFTNICEPGGNQTSSWGRRFRLNPGNRFEQSQITQIAAFVFAPVLMDTR